MADPNDTTLDAIEKAFLGSCIIVPDWLDYGALLRAEQFSTGARGLVFDTMRSVPRRRFDAALLAFERDRSGVPPPEGTWAWIVGDLIDPDNVAADATLIPGYVRAIKEAAALRRASRTGE